MAVFDLEAIIRLNDSGFKQGLSKAGKAIGTFAKVTGAAVAAGATAVGVLVKQSVDAYGEYEQLAGGVKKLYGNMGMGLTEYAESVGKSTSQAVGEWLKLEQAQSIVLNNAEKAFATAGMSANEYIDSVTGISARLVQSLGGDTVHAAKVADMAMRDIADNANTFGKYSAQELAGVYQALAKGQYQTLDNLSLPFAGTKAGMEDLIAHANELKEANGELGDLTIDSFADMVEAIHLVQDEYNITGTTEKEAAKTIVGSLNMTKAAWKNLVRAFGDKDADLSKYFDNLVTSAETAFNNILPVAEQAIKGIGQMFTDLAPVIGEKLPDIISSVLPDLVKSGASLVTSVLTGFATAAPAIVEAIPEVVKGIKDGFVASWPALKEAGWKLMEMAGEGIQKAGEKLKDLGKKAFDEVAPIAAQAFDNIKIAAEKRFPGITDLVSDTWSRIKSGTAKAWESITNEVGNVWQGLQDLWGEHSGQLSDAVGNIWEGVKQRWQGALDWWDEWGGTVTNVLSYAWESIKTVFSTSFSVISDLFSAFAAAFAGDWAGAWEELKRAGADAWAGIASILSPIWEGIKATASEIWGGIVSSLMDTWDGLKSKAKGAFDKISGAVSDAWSTIKGGVSTAWDGIKSAVSGAWDSLLSAVSWDSISAMAASAWSAVEGTVAGAWASISSAVSSAWDAVMNAPAWASIAAKGSEAWAALKGTISGAFTAIGNAISEAWEKVKGALSFKLPDITLGALPRLPKLSISGGFSIFPPSVPTISWNAKAMKNPYMFTDMTLFGAGEAGDEVLYGRTALMTDIQAGVASETDGLTQNLTAILEELRSYLPELARRPVVLNSGALVGGIGYDMDRQLGGYSDMGGRELSLA